MGAADQSTPCSDWVCWPLASCPVCHGNNPLEHTSGIDKQSDCTPGHACPRCHSSPGYKLKHKPMDLPVTKPAGALRAGWSVQQWLEEPKTMSASVQYKVMLGGQKKLIAGQLPLQHNLTLNRADMPVHTSLGRYHSQYRTSTCVNDSASVNMQGRLAHQHTLLCRQHGTCCCLTPSCA